MRGEDRNVWVGKLMTFTFSKFPPFYGHCGPKVDKELRQFSEHTQRPELTLRASGSSLSTNGNTRLTKNDWNLGGTLGDQILTFRHQKGPQGTKINASTFPDGSADKKNLPAMQETQARPLGWENSLEKGMATHSRILAWRIPWTEKPGRLRSIGSQRVGH